MTTQEIETKILDRVDARQVFTTSEFLQAIPVELDAQTELEKHQGLPPLPPDIDIQEIKLYVDGREARIWENGEVVMEIYLPSDYKVSNTIWTINGEIATIEIGSQMMLNRLTDEHTKMIEASQDVAKAKLNSNQN